MATLPPAWLELITDYLDCHEVVLPQVTEVLPWKTVHSANAMAFFLPPILPWSPREVYNFPLKCSICPEKEHVPLVADRWTLGQGSAQYNPRFLHSVNAPTLLISRVYKC